MPPTLPQLVQSLPRELFDHVFDLTFARQHTGTLHITIYSQPPLHPCLQVSKSTRATFAKAYYNSITFVFGDRKNWEDVSFFLRWLRSLPPEHRRELRAVQFKGDPAVNLRKYYYRRTQVANEILEELKEGLISVGIATEACDFLSVLVCQQHYRLVCGDLGENDFSWVMEV